MGLGLSCWLALFHIYDIQGGKSGHGQTRRSVNTKRRVGRAWRERGIRSSIFDPEPFAYPDKHTCRVSLGSLS